MNSYGLNPSSTTCKHLVKHLFCELLACNRGLHHGLGTERRKHNLLPLHLITNPLVIGKRFWIASNQGAEGKRVFHLVLEPINGHGWVLLQVLIDLWKGAPPEDDRLEAPVLRAWGLELWLPDRFAAEVANEIFAGLVAERIELHHGPLLVLVEVV